MKTQVIMKRELFGSEISQQSKTGFFSGTDLVRAGNEWRKANGLPSFNLSQWLKRESTVEFIAEIEAKHGRALKTTRGRNSATWLHSLLFIDAALAISPKLKIEVYGWLFDQLIKNRNDSGDSYKEMCGYLYSHYHNKQKFYQYASSVALKIRHAVGVSDWQTATEEQLRLRDRIHNDISILADVLNNNNQAVRIAIEKHITPQTPNKKTEEN